MKSNHRNPDEILDKVINGLRHEALDSAVINEAADRVWKNIATAHTEGQIVMAGQREQIEHISGCADFQALIPAYLDGEVSGARRLLIEDHTRECLPCRKALKTAREGNAVKVIRPAAGGFAGKVASMSAGQRAVMRWGIAAALVVGLGLAALPFVERFYYSFKVLNTVVEAANGPVYRVTDTNNKQIGIGEQIAKGEKIRTAKEAGAVVKLPDGSKIEMRERSEFWISENSQGTTIHLERGNIIVQAAKQRNKHLYVATADSTVSVTGTIFSVNSGTKGSRVSVVEGEVHVNHEQQDHVLRSGDQVTTSQTIERVRVADEISWSRDAGRYVAMLEEIAKLRKDLDALVSRPGLRYSTQLLNYAPDDMVFYVAVPNLTQTLAETNQIIQQRMAQNPALSQWWKQEGNAKNVNSMMDRIRDFGQYLGSEIVISAGLNAKGDLAEPVILAELSNAAGFRSYAESQLQELAAQAADDENADKKTARINNPVRFVDDVNALQAAPKSDKKGHEELLAWINGDVLVASPDAATLQRAAARANTQQSAVDGSFRSTIASLYNEGAGLIIAADLEKIIANGLRADAARAQTAAAVRQGGRVAPGRKNEAEFAKQIGLTNFKYFIAELKEKDGKPFNRAVVTFNQAERGINTWLAAPSPLGALDFISPDANVVASFAVKEPALLVDDLFAALSAEDEKFLEQLKAFETQHGISIRNDLAAPLGGEFAFAVDGPVVPIPSWKVVAEVYDQTRLQASLEKLVSELNNFAATQSKKGVALEKEEANGRTYYTLKSLDFPVQMTYTYAYGYLVACPSRALVERAIQYRESGTTIKSSAKFQAALPEDRQVSFSALFYSNLSSVLSPIARNAGSLANKLPEEERQLMKQAMNQASPAMLAYAYSYGDRMVFSLNTENGPLGLTPGSLLSLPGQAMFGNIIGKGMKQ